MILQQFGGVNAIAFYASSIFVSAGKEIMFKLMLESDGNIVFILPTPTQLSLWM